MRRCCPRRARAWWRLVKNRLRTGRSKVDLEAQYPVLERGRRVTQHGEVLEVQVGGVNDALALWTFDRWESAPFDGLGSFTESKHHLVGIKGRAHAAMIGLHARIELVSWIFNSVLLGCGRRQLWPAASEEWT